MVLLMIPSEAMSTLTGWPTVRTREQVSRVLLPMKFMLDRTAKRTMVFVLGVVGAFIEVSRVNRVMIISRLGAIAQLV